MLGEPIRLAQQTIGPEGGTIVIDKPGDPLHGFRLEIPPQSYAAGTVVTVSSQEIEQWMQDPHGHLLSPMIAIDSGGQYVPGYMKAEIPMEIPKDHAAMAFFYDEETGLLDGTPTIEQTDSVLKAAVRHDGKLVVTSTERRVLEKAWPSKFQHGVDSWQFPNHGSFLAPKGQCAGHVLTAMFYFIEKRLGEGAQPLYGRYDNYDNPYHATPDLWQDDELAYKLCAAVQNRQGQVKTLDVDAPATFEEVLALMDSDLESDRSDDVDTYLRIAKAIRETGLPQYIAVQSAEGGHALFVYKAADGVLSISDPNWISVEKGGGRQIVLDKSTGQFQDYPSGLTAKSSQTMFTDFEYLGGATTFNWEYVRELWAAFEQGAVGEGNYPFYEIVALEKDSWGNDAEFKLTNNYQTQQQEIRVRVETAERTTLQTTIYRSTATGEEKVKTVQCPEEVPLHLEPGVNSIGFLFESVETYTTEKGEEGTDVLWAGFDWINVVLAEEEEAAPQRTPMPFDGSQCNALPHVSIKSIEERLDQNSKGDEWCDHRLEITNEHPEEKLHLFAFHSEHWTLGGRFDYYQFWLDPGESEELSQARRTTASGSINDVRDFDRLYAIFNRHNEACLSEAWLSEGDEEAFPLRPGIPSVELPNICRPE